MLRSIFSLIQNIIDSDKEYNNKKSKTVIYLAANPDNTLNMDIEIDGKPRENLKSVKAGDNDDGSTFKITTEQGDMVTCKHYTNKKIVPRTGTKNEDDAKLCEEYKEQVKKERTVFTNDEEIIGDRAAVVGEEGKFDEWDETTVHDLLARLPRKQPKAMEKDKDHMTALMDQIEKMKTGMERLQEIAQHFNTSERFKTDVDYLTKTVGPTLKKTEMEDKKLSPNPL